MSLIHEELQHYIGKIIFSANDTPPAMYEYVELLFERPKAGLLYKNYDTVNQSQTKLHVLEIEPFDAEIEEDSAPVSAKALPTIEEHEAATVL